MTHSKHCPFSIPRESQLPVIIACMCEQITAAVAEAVAKERERCVHIALVGDIEEVPIPDEWQKGYDDADDRGDIEAQVRYELAAAIREAK